MIEHPTPAAPQPPRRRPKWLLLSGILAAVVLTAGVGAAYLASSETAPDPAASTAAAAQSSAVAAARSTPATCPNGRLPSGDCAGDPSAAAPVLINDRVAWDFCPAMLRAGATVGDPDKMEPLGKQAATSQDVGLATSGQLLADSAALARKAKDATQKQSILDDMRKRAATLTDMCTKAGFKP